MAVDKLLKDINSKFGMDVVFTADDEKFQIERIPTGILSLDTLLGGGFALGRWSEIYGDESSLKTTIALKLISEAQRLGHSAVYCDVERTISKAFLDKRNVDMSPSKLIIAQTETGEEMIDVIKAFVQGGEHKIIVIDSLASLLPRREHDLSREKDSVGSAGLLTSRMTRVLTSLNHTKVHIMMVNQTRQKIGMMFGDPTTTPGGMAPKFYASHRIRLIRTGTTKESNDPGKQAKRGNQHLTSMNVVAVLEKDKTGRRMGTETTITYDITKNEIDDVTEIINYGIMYGVIKRVNRMTFSMGKKKMNRQELEKVVSVRTRRLKEIILAKAIEADEK